MMPRGLDANCPRCGTKWPYNRNHKQFFIGECPAKCGYFGGPHTGPSFVTGKRLFDANSSTWAIRHIYVIMAVVGLIALASSYPFVRHLAEIVDNSSFDQTYVWFVFIVTHLLLIVGTGLILIAAYLAAGYWLIRRGVTFKLKGSNVA